MGQRKNIPAKREEPRREPRREPRIGESLLDIDPEALRGHDNTQERYDQCQDLLDRTEIHLDKLAKETRKSLRKIRRAELAAIEAIHLETLSAKEECIREINACGEDFHRGLKERGVLHPRKLFDW